MSTKELIQAELDTLSDADLEALYALIKQFIQSKRPAKPRSLMATLRGIQIDAPQILPPISICMSVERNVPNRIFIDTLFVIALMNRRDQYHQQALDLAEQFEGDPLLVTDVVLLEVENERVKNGERQV